MVYGMIVSSCRCRMLVSSVQAAIVMRSAMICIVCIVVVDVDSIVDF